MSSYDKVSMTLPDGSEFVGRGNLSVTIQQTPVWLFNGLQNVFAASDQVTGSSGGLTEQVFEGSGARIRRFTVEFDQWEGSTDAWGGAAADDDVLIKLQTLDHALATTPITSSNVATLEFGEYSSAGQFDPVAVVPGDVTLPVDLGERGSSFRPQVEWLDSVDLDQTLHQTP